MSTHEFRMTMQLRWRDMDRLGHLNQAVYHVLMEDARDGLLAALPLPDEESISYVLARVELDYRHEVRKEDGEVEVVVRVGRVGSKSLTLENDILLPDGTLAATGSTILVRWDRGTRGAKEISPDERAVLVGAGDVSGAGADAR